MTDNAVEGYSNYATFGVAVTLQNDREHAERIAEQIDYIRKVRAMLPQVRDGTWTEAEAVRFTFADFLRNMTEKLCEAGEPSLMGSQMIQAGLAEVDWQELADGYLAELRLQES